MSENATRTAIVKAGRQLFGEHGYAAVTIKDVAAQAGYSPAMVMKVMGSKAELYAASAPEAPVMDDDGLTDEPVGFQLARRIVARRDHGEPEPWAMAPVMIRDAPDREAAREELASRYISHVAGLIGDRSAQRHKAQLVVSALLGLGAGIRTFGLLGAQQVHSEALIQQYGSLLQAIVDAPDFPESRPDHPTP
jgi:AcrR family transcriptional regulator